MPVGISSAARNLFLLGSSGADVVTNFFKAIDQSSGSDDGYITTGLGVGEVNVAYLGQSNYNEYHLSGTKTDGNSKIIGWVDKRQEDGTLDWNVEVNETGGNNVLLNDLYLDANHTGLDGDHEVIVCGGAGSVPFVSKYDKDGVVIWSATSQTADVTYNGVTSSSEAAGGSAGYEGDVYACGNTDISGSSYAVVEKFNGATGAPDWGKRFSIEGADVVLHAIDTQPRGEYVVAGGYLQDINSTKNNFKGYFAKIDSASGDVIWDRTLELTDREWGTVGAVEINDVCVDDNGFIYVVGSQFNGVSGFSAGYICKYTPEGNMLWQKETAIGGSRFNPSTNTVSLFLRWRYNRVKVDTQTGQIIILGSYHESSTDEYGVLIKYSSSGKKIFERIIESTEAFPPEFGTLTHPQGGMALDADPSFYYVLFTDQELNTASLIPNKYTFGKVSSSGNGLGAFSYDTGDTNTIEYLIHDIEDRIGKLSDGSVRNDTSDLATNILNPTKIMFDDLATPITNKKRQMDRAGDFVISGSPAVRPADFQEMNLLRETDVDITTGPTYSIGWAGSINNPASSFDGNLSSFAGSNGGTFGPFVYTFSTPITGVTSARLRVNLGATSAQVGATTNVILVDGTDVTQKAKNANAYADVGFQWIDVTTEVGDTWNTFSIEGTSGSTNPSIAAVEVNGTILVNDFSSGTLLDQSGKGNNGIVTVADESEQPNPGFGSVEFDGVDDYLSMPDSQLLELLDSDFTIEFWIYPTGIPQGTYACIFAKGINVQCYFMSNYSIGLFLDNNNNGTPYGVIDNSNLTGQNSVSLNQWSHIAICRSGNTWKAFVNGVEKYSNVIPGLDPVYNSSDDFTIGDYGPSPGTYNFQGYISNFHFVKGTSLYSANFTVPTSPLTSITETSLLTCQGNTIVDARIGTPNVITANGGIAPSQFRLSPSVNADGYWDFNGVDDYVTTSFPNDAIASGDANSEYTLEAWINVRTSSGTTTNADCIMGHNTNRGVGMQVGVSNSKPRVNYGARYTSNFFGPTFNYNEWRHIVLTRDGTEGAIAYENGVEVARTNNTTDLDVEPGYTPGDFNIGYAGPRISGYFDGLIGEARVYTRALSAQAVFQNYNSTKTRYTNELPEVAPKVGPGISYNGLVLNYDFSNGACISKNTIRDRDVTVIDADDYLSRDELESTELLIESPLGNKGDFFGRAVASADGIVAVSDDVVSHDFWFNGITSRSETPGSEVYLYNFGDAVDRIGSDNSAYEADFITTIRPPETYWNREVAKRQGALSVGDGRVVFTCDPFYGINVVENEDVTPMAYVAICDYRGNVLKVIHDPNTIDNARQLTPIGYNPEHLDLERGVWVRDSSITTGFGHQAKIYKGKIYVADNANEKIFIYTLAGDPITSIGIPESQDYGDYQAFGTYISLNDNILAVGASNDERNDPVNNRGCGSVYLFSTDNLSYLRKILPSVELDKGDFGEVVEIGHDRIVVGQPQTFASIGNPSGHVELFDYDGNFISRLDTVNNVGDDLGSQAQSSFAITDKYVFVGYAQTGRGQVNAFDRVTGAHQGRVDPRLPLGETTGNFGRSMTTASNGYDHKLIVGNTKSEGKIYYYDLTKREVGTTVKNLSSSSVPGTVNGPTFNSAGYWEFDGDDDYIDLGTQPINSDLNASSPSGGGLTVEWWGYSNGTGDNYQRIVDRSNDGGALNGWAIYTGLTGSSTLIRLSIDGESTVIQSTSFLDANEWEHWMVSWDETTGNWAWYKNGAAAGSGTATYSIPAVETGMRIGTWNHSTGREYNGSIGELRIYSRALTAAEASKNYNATRSKYGV